MYVLSRAIYRVQKNPSHLGVIDFPPSPYSHVSHTHPLAGVVTVARRPAARVVKWISVLEILKMSAQRSPRTVYTPDQTNNTFKNKIIIYRVHVTLPASCSIV